LNNISTSSSSNIIISSILSSQSSIITRILSRIIQIRSISGTGLLIPGLAIWGKKWHYFNKVGAARPEAAVEGAIQSSIPGTPVVEP